MSELLSALAGGAVFAAATLLPVINPPGTAPIFLSVTPGVSQPTRAAMAGSVARYSFLLLCGAMLIGSYVLLFFGLSLAVVKIAGGLLVTATAWHLIRAEQTPDAEIVASASDEPAQMAGHTFYPLTFPLTVGPGAMSVAVTIGAGMRVEDGGSSIVSVIGAFLGILLVCYTIYLSFRFAAPLMRLLGRTGTVVLLRMSAFILLSIGVQILSDGLVERFMPGGGS